jgi:hypothetical protein
MTIAFPIGWDDLLPKKMCAICCQRFISNLNRPEGLMGKAEADEYRFIFLTN